jgi:adenylyltransferase/sulfurtransferase
VDAATLKRWLDQEEVQLIDVREAFEYEKLNIGGLLMPLSELGNHLKEIDPAKLTVVHCQSGVRSAKAIEVIKTTYPGINIYNLKNGLKDY